MSSRVGKILTQTRRSIKPRSRKSKRSSNGNNNQSENETQEKIITSSSSLSFLKESTQHIPSFHEFLHRQQVLTQYRDFFRSIRVVKDDINTRKTMENEVRTSFKRLMYEKDNLSISMAIKEGEQRLKELKSMVGYVSQSQQQRNRTKTDHDVDSWLNIDDKDDPRGRVGTNWPWENK